MLNVSYRTSGKLSCPCDGDVILCVDDSLVLSGAPFVEGKLTSVTQSCDACGNLLYTYYVEYDENDLVDPTTPLVSLNVSGIVCRSCLTSYIDWLQCHFTCSGYDYIWPTDVPVAGQSLKVLSVVGTTVTLEWA